MMSPSLHMKNQPKSELALRNVVRIQALRDITVQISRGILPAAEGLAKGLHTFFNQMEKRTKKNDHYFLLISINIQALITKVVSITESR